MEDINIYDKYFEYGKLKNFLNEPPCYRIG